MTLKDSATTTFRRVLSRGEPSNGLLRTGLGALALAWSLAAVGELASRLPWGVDLLIPLHAAARWLSGGRAYVPEAFVNGSGNDQPFLYPPYALPLFAPLTVVAEQPLSLAWLALSLALAVATCRHLGMASRWIPLVLVWPPFAEGLIAGNVQIAIFAAFTFLFSGGLLDDNLGPSRSRTLLLRGFLGAATAFLKVSQPHVLVYLIRWERRAFAAAVGALGLLVVATLPLTGTVVWVDWIEQLRRAADPGWVMAGPSLARHLPSPLAAVMVLACLVAVLAVPRVDAAAWVGVLLVLGAPSLHTYYLLFLLPAMLRIRREIALVAALLVATYTEPGWWLAIALVAGALALSPRYSALLEPSHPTRARDLAIGP